MSKSSMVFTVISGDAMMNKFARACDIFEESKVVGNVYKMTFYLEDGVPATAEKARETIPHVRESLEKTGQIVTFVHMESYTNGNVTVTNIGEVLPYVNKKVRCVSDGTKWFVLHKFISFMTGLEVVIDEHCFVKAVGMSVENDDVSHLRL